MSSSAGRKTGKSDAGPGVGIEFRKAHFPGRAPIDTYGNGGFRFASMSHQGSILCIPSGIYGWEAKSVTDFSVESFQRVLNEQDLEILMLGTGVDLVPLQGNLKARFEAKGIRVEVMSTGSAARTFNVLLSEGRAVGAALLAVS